MSTFIIRSQGFFYTDEYYAPGEVFKQVVKQTFPTRQAAEAARAELVRRWVRSEPLANYLFDDDAAIDAVQAYLRTQWPGDFDSGHWLYDAEIPKDATDQQVDEIVKRMNITFAQVFEVKDGEAEAADDRDADDDAEFDDADFDDDLHFGPAD